MRTTTRRSAPISNRCGGALPQWRAIEWRAAPRHNARLDFSPLSPDFDAAHPPPPLRASPRPRCGTSSRSRELNAMTSPRNLLLIALLFLGYLLWNAWQEDYVQHTAPA